MKKILRITIIPLLCLYFISCTSDDISDKSGDELETEYSELLNKISKNEYISANSNESDLTEVERSISRLKRIGSRLKSIDKDKYGSLVINGNLLITEVRKKINSIKELNFTLKHHSSYYDKIKNNSEELEFLDIDISKLNLDELNRQKNITKLIISLANEYNKIITEEDPCDRFTCNEDIIDQLYNQKQFIESKREFSLILKSKIEREILTL